MQAAIRRSTSMRCRTMPRTSSAVYSRTGGSARSVRAVRVSSGSFPRSSASNKMSRARLRALLRVEWLRGRGASVTVWVWGSGDPAEVVARAGVDLDLLAVGDEQRHLDLQTGLERGRLRAAGAAVALEAGLGVGDLQLDRRRQVDVERVVLVDGHGRDLLLEQVVLRVPDDLVADRDLLVGRGVHEQ